MVNDPKGEVFAATAGYMQAQGYRVISVNPEAVETSSRFNPLLEAKTDIELEQVAEVLVRAGSGNSSKDQFWDNGAVRLVAVLLKLLRRSSQQDPAYFTLGNLYRLLQNFGSDGSPLDPFVIRWAYDPVNPSDDTLWEEWKGATTGNLTAVQSFALTALTALRAFTNQDMVRLTASSSFDLESIRSTKTIIYFIIPAQHAEYYGFWTSVFFRSVFNACMRRLPDSSSLPVYILYDEFGHSTIPGFVSVANTIRGYRVSLSIVLQSISQLSARYGQDYARSIQGGFTTYLTYSGSDPETARFFEQVSGRVIEHTEAEELEGQSQHHEYNLLNADAVRRLSQDEALLVSGNRYPAILKTRPYFLGRRFRTARKIGTSACSRPAASKPEEVRRVPIWEEKLD